MVTIAQCRAARGLLGWTQQELADAAGMSKTAINNFEKGHSDMKAESLRAIRTAFEARDIEFIAAAGVRIREDRTEVLSGHGAFGLLLDDIAQTLRGGGSAAIIAPPQNGWPEQEKHLERHLADLPIEKIKILCAPEDAALWQKIGRCRRIDTRQESAMPSFCYGHKVAIVLWKFKSIVVIGAPVAAEAEKERFEFLWNTARDLGGKSQQSRA